MKIVVMRAFAKKASSSFDLQAVCIIVAVVVDVLAIIVVMLILNCCLFSYFHFSSNIQHESATGKLAKELTTEVIGGVHINLIDYSLATGKPRVEV